MVKIEVLYFEGCPNHRPALQLVEEVMGELGISGTVEEVQVDGPERAIAVGFLGSPSIRVDGLDVEVEARSRTNFGYSCRTYNGEGLPPRETVEAALLHAGAERPSGGRTFMGVAVGTSVLTAVLSSACCWLPLSLAGLGFSVGGLAVVFGTLRPFFLGASSLLLVMGFFMARRKEAKCASDGACAEEASTVSFRFRRYSVLAMAAMIVALFGFFPEYGATLVAEEAWAVTDAAAGDYTRLSFEVEGMTCESCARRVAKTASSVDGVVGADVDLATGRAEVVVRASAGDLSRFIADRIKDAGFDACLSTVH